MRIPLNRTPGGFLALAVTLVTAVWISLAAARVWRADRRNDSSDPGSWLRAAQLEPSNAEYWHHVGLFEEWDLERGDPQQAITYLRRATEANPHSDLIWMDLASAEETLGETDQARQAYQRAQADHPASAEVAWRYGSFLLRQGEIDQAGAKIRRAITQDPRLTPIAVSQCWRAGLSTAQILGQILPAQSNSYLIALDFLVSEHEADAALEVWKQLVGLRQQFAMSRAVALVEELIQQNREEEALQVWRQALGASGWPHEPGEDSSLVFNGGFEHDVVNGGFDWREVSLPGAAYELDASVHHSGARSLRVTFDGSRNLNFDGVKQYVVVKPSRPYHFVAYLRTDAISTDMGVGFEIYDPRNGSFSPILTPALTGTHPWTPLSADFSTGPQTHLLVILLRRAPTWKLDNKLRGSVWVDDVSLTPSGGDAAGGSP